MKKFFNTLILGALFCQVIFAQDSWSTSTIDWTQRKFISTVELDIEKAGISLPAGRSTAEIEISKKMPELLKDPLSSLYIDSSKQLGDEILSETVSLEQITTIIEDSKKTPPYFSNENENLVINHEIDLSDISSLFIKHRYPYNPKKTINKISSRVYTGIIIDARGVMPVQGEFVKENANPCFFPKIWDSQMNLIYEKNMENADIAKKNGVVSYHYSNNELLYENIVGNDPLRITAEKIFGINRTDPVISQKDALKILSVPENRALLTNGKIVVLLDKDKLIHDVSVPEKTDSYYVIYRDTENFFYERKIPDVKITDTYKGIQISVQDLKFKADSNELLPEETIRLDAIYENLARITQDNEYSILVEGHTASVGKPTGEMNLSVERAKKIIDEMVERGLERSKFSYKGYGGTNPIANNATEEGRAQNRRVEIILIPKATYIQRM